MTKILFPFTEQERSELFTNTSIKLGISPDMVEKDFWVCGVMGNIFNDTELSQILCFKGGTSLSKLFRVIERFSEDIDLILSQKIILRDDEKLEQDSNTKQAKFNEEIEARAEHYITTELKEKIAKVLDGLLKVYTDKEYTKVESNYNPVKYDKYLLHVVYPKAVTTKYLLPAIKLEIGPLSLWNPNEKYPLSSYVAETYPNLGIESVSIPTIKPERTFWEKLTILHHEHYRPKESSVPMRYARHYYDVFKMGHSEIKNKALANFNLLDEVATFKKRFYPRGWAKYDEARKGTLRLYPAEHNLEALKNDYVEMQRMIFGNIPKWKNILEYLRELENEINKL